jgi:hypothetical protein
VLLLARLSLAGRHRYSDRQGLVMWDDEFSVAPGDVALIVNGEFVTSCSQAVFAALWSDAAYVPDMVSYTSLVGEL